MADDSNYSKREIDSQHNEVIDFLRRIEAQTVKTNGRVNKLEAWRALLIGGWVVVTTFVLPLMIYTYISQITDIKSQMVDINTKIERQSEQQDKFYQEFAHVLASYNIQVK